MKKRNYILLVIIILLIASLSVFFKTDFPHALASGAIGSTLTIVVTMFLLEKQTGSEEIKERNSKVFEKKIEIYEKFIEKVRTITQDNSIDDEELKDIIFDLAIIRIHTDGSNVVKIWESFGKITTLFENIDDEDKTIDPIVLSQELFKIVEIFELELYKEKKGDTNLQTIQAIEAIEKTTKQIQDKIAKYSKTVFTGWDQYIENQKDKGISNNIIELSKFVIDDIKDTYKNEDFYAKLTPTHVSFTFNNAKSRLKKFLFIDLDKTRLGLAFIRDSVEELPQNAVPGYKNKVFRIYIKNKDEYNSEIKDLIRKSLEYIKIKNDLS